MHTKVSKIPTAVLCCAVFFLLLIGIPPAGADPMKSNRDIGHVGAGQSLYASLKEKGLSPHSIQHILKGLKTHIDFRRVQPDTAYHFTLDARGELKEFIIETEKDLLYLSVGRERYAVRRLRVARKLRLETVHARIDRDLREAVQTAGEAVNLSMQFEEILSQDLEVPIDLEKGDQFRLVVEKILAGDWLLRYGHIEGFEVRRGDTIYRAIRHKGGYYDEEGRSLIKQFLRVPLHYQFVSSEFMKKRKHPILGGVRPHRGIDFVAPLGTPIWAIADGQVLTAGIQNGYGRLVIVRHTHGYESLYAHLSHFAPGIGDGATVRQKQVIGYIGVTGLSTGPHLHYGLTRDGDHRDPLKEVFPRATITHEEAAGFAAKKEMIVSLLAADAERPTSPAR